MFSWGRTFNLVKITMGFFLRAAKHKFQELGDGRI